MLSCARRSRPTVSGRDVDRGADRHVVDDDRQVGNSRATVEYQSKSPCWVGRAVVRRDDERGVGAERLRPRRSARASRPGARCRCPGGTGRDRRSPRRRPHHRDPLVDRLRASARRSSRRPRCRAMPLLELPVDQPRRAPRGRATPSSGNGVTSGVIAPRIVGSDGAELTEISSLSAASRRRRCSRQASYSARRSSASGKTPRMLSPASTRSSAHSSRSSCSRRVVRDLLGQRRGDDDDALGVADDHVARHDQHAAAGDRHVRLERVVQRARARARAAPGSRSGCSSPATAGLSRRPPSVTMPVAPRAQRAQREDVADRAGARLAARLDHEHLAGRDRSRPRASARSARRCPRRRRPRAAAT